MNTKLSAKKAVYSYTRISSDQQKSGTGIKRQIDKSRRLAERWNLPFAEELIDAGKSGYHSEHMQGAFGSFVKAAQKGEIVEGSILVVEAIDRIGREEIKQSFPRFVDLLEAGIKIHVISTGQTYDRKSGFSELLAVFLEMGPAHEYSKKLSDRAKAAWEYRRKAAAETGRPMGGGKIPSWIRFDKKTKKFELIPERAVLVKRIVQEYLSGVGVAAIMKRLNNEEIPAFGYKYRKNPKTGKSERIGPNQFTPSAIHRLLRTPSIAGMYQPKKTTMALAKREPDRSKGKMVRTLVPEGPMLKDYFPAVISEADFYEIQGRLKKNRVFKGRKADRCGNLFMNIAECGECGSSMRFFHKPSSSRKKTRNYYYLRCKRNAFDIKAQNGEHCQSGSINYRQIEPQILKFTIGLKPGEVIPGNGERESKLESLKDRLTGIEKQIEENETRIGNLQDAMEVAKSKRAMERNQNRIDTLENEIEGFEKQKNELIKLIEQNLDAEIKTAYQINSIKNLYTAMDKAEGQDLLEIREKLMHQIRSLIQIIQIFPRGFTDSYIRAKAKAAGVKASLDQLRNAYGSNRENLHIVIVFRSGVSRIIRIDADGKPAAIETIEKLPDGRVQLMGDK